MSKISSETLRYFVRAARTFRQHTSQISSEDLGNFVRTCLKFRPTPPKISSELPECFLFPSLPPFCHMYPISADLQPCARHVFLYKFVFGTTPMALCGAAGIWYIMPDNFVWTPSCQYQCLPSTTVEFIAYPRYSS